MTQSLEALTRRSDSMKGIRSIVHTMKTLSVINAAPYDHAATAIEAYHATILSGLHAVLSQSGPAPTQHATRGEAGRVLIAFGSDHGLCGNYNQALAEHIIENVGNKSGLRILCVGAQMADALRDHGFAPEATLFPPASVDGIGRLANLLTQRLDAIRQSDGEIGVSLGYFMRDAQTGAQKGGQHPEIVSLLPLDPALMEDLRKPWASRSLPSFTMPQRDLLQSLIRGHLFASMFRAAAEALVTENAARLAMMQQAEQSIDDRLDALTSSMRSVRQTEITTELLDVIIGFEALKNRKGR